MPWRGVYEGNDDGELLGHPQLAVGGEVERGVVVGDRRRLDLGRGVERRLRLVGVVEHPRRDEQAEHEHGQRDRGADDLLHGRDTRAQDRSAVEESHGKADGVLPPRVERVVLAVVVAQRRVDAGAAHQAVGGPGPAGRAGGVDRAVEREHRLGDAVEVGARREPGVEPGRLLRRPEPLVVGLHLLRTAGLGELAQVVDEVAGHRGVDDRGVDEPGVGDQHVLGDATAHRAAEHAHPVVVHVRQPAQCPDGVRGVARVAEARVQVDRGDVVRPGVAAVVGVQHDVARLDQPHLLAGEPLPGLVHRRIDVAVVEDDGRERPRAARPEQLARDPQPVAAVGDLVLGVRRLLLDRARDAQTPAVERFPHDRGQREGTGDGRQRAARRGRLGLRWRRSRRGRLRGQGRRGGPLRRRRPAPGVAAAARQGRRDEHRKGA